MARYAVLLRGINVGRAKRVGMADLRELLTGAGYENVATLLQSGNVVLDGKGPATKLARSVETLISERFGFPVDVVVRTRQQVQRVVAANPLGDVAHDGSRHFVAFMATRPDASFLGTLQSVDAGGDQFVHDGTELYVWCPKGLLDSPLMTALGKIKDGPVTTVRNWNTVEKLATMLG